VKCLSNSTWSQYYYKQPTVNEIQTKENNMQYKLHTTYKLNTSKIARYKKIRYKPQQLPTAYTVPAWLNDLASMGHQHS
jgi:hypothetical protein